jgi:hypothetical protein
MRRDLERPRIVDIVSSGPCKNPAIHPGSDYTTSVRYRRVRSETPPQLVV